MRKLPTLCEEEAGQLPADHHVPCHRISPETVMINSTGNVGVCCTGRCSRFWLLFTVMMVAVAWAMPAEAAPISPAVSGSYAIADSGKDRSDASLRRCPAIFNSGSVGSKGNVVTTKTVSSRSRAAEASPPCRYFLRSQNGTLTTPGFPSAFPLPFICSWIIDATRFEPDSFITLYLTQMYLTRGVKAVQHSFRNETHAVGSKELDELHTMRSRPFSVYRIKARYLEVQVNLHELANANLRVERRLMDDYGFNITYEIQPNGSRIRSDTCNAFNCTFNGHCYANHNYSQFQCACFPGFSGKYCQYGPECDPEKGINVCKNGGVCAYRTGLTVVRCNCPPNYNGSLCEFRREFIPAKECLSRFRLNCSHHCAVTDKGVAACRCPLDQALRSDGLTCYPLVPLRIVGQVELKRPSSMNDTRFVEGVTAALEKMVHDYTASLLAVGSVQLAQPGSGRLQFVLWNSENNIKSWASPAQGPVVAAVRSRSGSQNRTSAGVAISNAARSRASRNVVVSYTAIHIPQHWNNSYTSFVHQISSKTWRVLDESMNVSINSITQVPALIIEWVKLDVKGQVREGYPFTVACKANGSKNVKLYWYKDGSPVDPSHALLRNVSVEMDPQQDLRGFFILYLNVKQASLADRGEYECRANDWGQAARKSVFLDVLTPPILDLVPANPAVQVGTAVNLTCRDENHLARRSITKYVWLKNGQPIESSCDEIIEDLIPVGSLLKITSIQQSTNYTCRGENGLGPASKTTRIFVVQPGKTEACPQQRSRGVDWPVTAVDATSHQFCPAGYVGVARRRCRSVKRSLVAADASAADEVAWSWEEPDFARCSNRQVSELYKHMKLVALGYLVADVPSIVKKFTEFVQAKLVAIDQNHGNSKRLDPESIPHPYLPGEGNSLMEMGRNIEYFSSRKPSVLPPQFWNSIAVRYLYTLDALLSVPADFFHPDGGVPIMRLIQNHLMLMGRNSSGEHPLDLIEPSILKNSDFVNKATRKEFRYKDLLKALPSQTGFKSLKQLAPAKFILEPSDGSGTNSVIFKLSHSLQREPAGGKYLCAVLHSQPADHQSSAWDTESCTLATLADPSFVHCNCSRPGTVMLLLVERETDALAPTFDLWTAIYFAAATSGLVVITSLAVLSARWYRRRTLWAWFQIQLGASLLLPSAAYFLPAQIVASDSFWTIVLTETTYQYVATVWAMMMHCKMDDQLSAQPEQASSRQSQRNFKLVSLSFVIPLTLSAVQSLVEEFRSYFTGLPFVSWLIQLNSTSGIFFCMVYCAFVLVIVGVYVLTVCKKGSFEKLFAFAKQDDAYLEHKRNYRCCVFLVGLSMMFIGSTLYRLHWPSLDVSCVTSFVHLLAILLWSALMLSSGDSGFVCAFWCFWNRTKLPGGDTVCELLNANASDDFLQRTGFLNIEEDSKNDPRSISQGSDDSNKARVPTKKRSTRSCPASSPLLQRAGLGPDVLRAFGIERSHSADRSSERLPEMLPNEVAQPDCMISSSRDRTNSVATSDGMQRDDLDSGFGPSGGGGSQKLNGTDKFSDAWKFLSRIRWKLPSQLGLPSNSSVSGGSSFRSRKSTLSSANTVDLNGEGGSSSSGTTEETEVPVKVAQRIESLIAPYVRSRTRWTEDYGQGNELDCMEISNLTLKCKPFRGRCFIRCSPEKNGTTALWSSNCGETSDGQLRDSPSKNNCCERCWHNPEIPYCDLCLSNPSARQTPGTISVRAVIESPPAYTNKDDCEYLKMDPAGSLAIDQQCAKRVEVYYNLTPHMNNQTSSSTLIDLGGNIADCNRNNKDDRNTALPIKHSISP